MTYTYEKITDSFNNTIIKRTDKNGLVAWIPMVEGNTDYEAYLADETAPK